jgi:hypothetical protein
VFCAHGTAARFVVVATEAVVVPPATTVVVAFCALTVHVAPVHPDKQTQLIILDVKKHCPLGPHTVRFEGQATRAKLAVVLSRLAVVTGGNV